MRDHFESSGEEERETGAIITRERHRQHIEMYVCMLPCVMLGCQPLSFTKFCGVITHMVVMVMVILS